MNDDIFDELTDANPDDYDNMNQDEELEGMIPNEDEREEFLGLS